MDDVWARHKPVPSFNINSSILLVLITAGVLLNSKSIELPVIHTLMEISCIVVALISFLIVWNSYNNLSETANFISLGFLVIAVFNFYHTIYFPTGNLYRADLYNLNNYYWALGRLSEALVLLIAANSAIKVFRYRRIVAILTLALSIIICQLFLYYSKYLPLLSNNNGAISMKTGLEYLVVILLIMALFRISQNFDDNKMFSYKYILIAILFAISSELIFIIFQNSVPFWDNMGHLLRVGLYLFVYQSIITNVLRYPYEDLQKYRHTISKVMEALPLGVVLYVDSRLIYANQNTLSLLDCKHNQLKQGLLDSLLGSTVTGKINASGLVSIQSDSGTKNVIIDRYSINAYTVLYVLSQARDQQELHTISFQTRTVLNNILKVVLLTDENNLVVTCNRAFEELTGLSETLVIGLSVKNLMKMLDIRDFTVVSRNPYNAIAFVEIEGNINEVHIERTLIENIDKEFIGSLYLATNVTKIREEEMKLERQERLAAIGQMAAGIVHEIKNPLTTIKGFSQIMSSGALEPEDVEEYANIIEESTNIMNQVVSDFLAYAKPKEPHLELASPNSLIKNLGIMIEGQLFLQNASVSYDLCQDEVWVLVDTAQIKQVLLNLVKNAIEATESKDRREVVLLSRNNGSTFTIQIRDNGCGIPAEKMQYLGKPFYTTKERGTGLGLSICYQIISKNGGLIKFDSKIGKGTIVSLSFPVHKPTSCRNQWQNSLQV